MACVYWRHMRRLRNTLAPVLAPVLALSSALGAASALDLRVLVTSGPTVRVRVPLTTAPAYPATATAPVTPTEWDVGVRGGKLTLSGQDSGTNTLYLAPTPGGVVGIGNTTYRGGVLLRAVGGRVDAVNVVNLEDYLRGVVAAEMPASWSPDALRAQAVIARSYASARINPAAPYDLCATDQCQVYGGVARETPATDAAVAATRGQVVSWNGAIAKTYFSSDSGGYTASSAEVWGTDLPYLVSQPDPASQSPRSAWNITVPFARVLEVAARYKVRVGTLAQIGITRVSASGRPIEITFQGDAGTARLGGADAGGFVRSLGAYSTRVTFSADANGLILSGAGNGHGVGLSQWGAGNLAGAGWNHLQILGFYFPGAALSTLQEASGAVVPTPGSAYALADTRPMPRPDVLDAALAVGADVDAVW